MTKTGKDKSKSKGESKSKGNDRSRSLRDDKPKEHAAAKTRATTTTEKMGEVRTTACPPIGVG